ncbi:hypothetical protein CC85DRAFT_305181 [Cutaneotrichosporon oleaginosum]|uniref:Uncharacterized protein n=1 Tax=Cutaneotrichosporon oleaginosum TaxID=879819 RepID=A0A0J0XDU6_9TREE|nr:uncharacterized protein CC85DRAFT_305181 [Cutaneotrichosporon oleaginosum]KLT39275.1 hypothetical protein CC85DRAFT_305181 [Cutaneotrichosporon oleaginosum]TXT05892.1 hypothetical protein COLE_07212 [Cutaneotrichosporon oleaginosum]
MSGQSALSAAIAGVSTFATRRRSRRDSPPPPGSDSFYGVRSLDSVDWESEPSSGDSSEDSSNLGPVDDTPSAVSTSLPLLGASPSSTSSSTTTLARASQAPSPRPSLAPIDSPPRLEGTPTPPAAALASPAINRPPPLAHTLFDMLADAPSASEPSSPASFDSMSVTLSSLSRTSSLLEDWRPYDSEAERRGLDALGLETRPVPQRAGTELVLPTLSLPSTSLHLGLERWNGAPAGTRIALLAGPERTRDVLGALAARRKCVQLPHGHVGVVEHGRLSATILTGLKAADVRDRAVDAYAALHALLDAGADTPELESSVKSYASRADWVHLVIPLDDADTHDLDGAVPVTTLRDEAARLSAEMARDDAQTAALAEAATDNVLDFDLPTPLAAPVPTPADSSGSSDNEPPSPSKTPSADIDCTPPTRDREREPWQFSSRLPGVDEEDEAIASTASLLDPDVAATVSLLERVISDPASTVKASAAVCLAYVPPSSTTSPASSTYAAPLPTIRSAGGEWEATLSRRLAHRRELDAQARRRRPRPRRRQTTPDPCGPLFPRGRGTSSVGLADVVARAFAPVRKVLARTSWTQVAIACAVALAVGCGFWAVRAH